MIKNLEELKNQFKNKDLFDQALTHRSWVNENAKIRKSNERLEFLGDAVLELIVSEELYQAFPDKEEGYLSSLRAGLVNNTQTLAKIAQKLELGKDIYFSKGEAEGGGRTNLSILADCLEALIGAIYLDRGLKAAKQFIKDSLLGELETKDLKPLQDPKSHLQQIVQAQKLSVPKYEVVKETGPAHSKLFVVQVIVDEKVVGIGEGKSKMEAQQQAASAGLVNFVKKK